ncbi:hypothetical protein CONCODRAFT_11694 [Conidiobolus coronatus NRRL 28638]|uniref:G-protein coupled receptors family 1 profile domain-containing protein n=1 Tax=Conidiobolus coronatus (strain ATCC 28846 / CBS 209.66 / NRRL 28638) TaxID=796925 RepID=A0A137NUM0_CONC2|nr:hypothetical protein CONCODRAFT_11694 [Conidiobolus coronatus NRRL 28638]|eukprot:KXN66459.1 hypothetical protein CONCODRAFT_11694 [Conidiobolus coronatus NRRL 28638]
MNDILDIGYLLQPEPIIVERFDFFTFWSICCNVGTIICLINTTFWHVILGTDIDDKITFSLQYIGLISCVLYDITETFIYLEFQPDNILIWYIISCVAWQLVYNCYLIMFFKQSAIWFGKSYRNISILVLIVLNIFMAIDYYYYFAVLLIGTPEIISICQKFDFAVTTGLSVIELIYNIITIYKIIKEAIKSRNPHTRTLIIKLTSVIGIFFLADLAISLAFEFVDESYAIIFWPFLFALKLQTEYFCLNRIRQCLIIMNTIDNV